MMIKQLCLKALMACELVACSDLVAGCAKPVVEGSMETAPSVAARLDERTEAFLGELKALPGKGKYFVSFTYPWNAENDNPESKLGILSGKVPKIHFEDFRFVTGTWKDPKYYARCRKRLTNVIRELYETYGSVPVFSWHPENPYAPKGWKDPKGRGAPYRYRYCVEGYPQEHRHVIAEMLTPGTEAAKWYDARLAEIAGFLNGLKDSSGRHIPCVVRLFHECEDDWSWWGAKSVSVEDYVRIWRKTVSYLRANVNDGRSLLFLFSPDRYWSKVGVPGENGTFLWRYPGDDLVDIIGFDDYSIGKAKDQKSGKDTEQLLEVTIGKIRLVSQEAAKRGKACGLVETGCKGKIDGFYDLLARAMSAEGCGFGFVNTWSGDFTMPSNDAMKESFLRYVESPRAVFAGEYKPLKGR